MKFLSGFITGVVITILVLLIIYVSSKSNDSMSGLTIFPKKGECITKDELEIFQTLKPNMALAEFGKFPDETLVLLINYEDKSYYDGQKIQVPENLCARQIGIYQYESKMQILKTVPVVVIE